MASFNIPMLAKEDLCMIRGDTFSFDVKINGEDPTNISDVFFTVKKKATEIQNVVQKSFKDEGFVWADESTLRCRVAPEDTEDVKAGKYVYDISMNIGDDVYTILMGNFEIIQDVTT